MNTQAKVLPKPVDWDELYPGRFLKASDFKGKPVTLKIAEVKLEELVGDKGPQTRGVMSFEKTDKQLALNKTNGICLKTMFGRKVQEWVGKRVTLFSSTWNGEDCVRVYGSPDIDDDIEATIALPRKRPFAMTLHKTTAGSVKAVDAPPPDDGDEAQYIKTTEKRLRACETVQALGAIWIVVQARYKNREIPLELQVAHDEMRQALEQQ